MTTILDDLLTFLEFTDLEQITCLGVVILAVVSLIFLFKKLV